MGGRGTEKRKDVRNSQKRKLKTKSANARNLKEDMMEQLLIFTGNLYGEFQSQFYLVFRERYMFSEGPINTCSFIRSFDVINFTKKYPNVDFSTMKPSTEVSHIKGLFSYPTQPSCQAASYPTTEDLLQKSPLSVEANG